MNIIVPALSYSEALQASRTLDERHNELCVKTLRKISRAGTAQTEGLGGGG